MDTQALKAFLAVAESQSFSLAAERLHLTQSAISKRIQQLEMSLDTSLFDRHNRTISLTEAGEALLPRARDILHLISDTELQLHSIGGKVSGQLSLATSHHIGLHRLPPLLRQFTAQHPQAHINLSFIGSERAFQAIQQRQVELALTTLDSEPSSEVRETFSIQPLWQDELVCVCAPNHPLAQQSITLETLSHYPAILPEPDTITFQLIERVFRTQGVTLHAPMPTNYLETIKMMVSVGMGWSMLPRTMLDAQLHALVWPEQPIQRALGIIYLKQRTLSNAARAFMALLPPEPVPT